MRYDFPADVAYIAPVVPAAEVIEKQNFSVIDSVSADDIFVHYISYEILIQSARIHEFLSRLFQILCQIPYCLRQFVRMRDGLKIVSAELLREKTVEGVKIEQKNDLLAVAEYIIGKN